MILEKFSCFYEVRFNFEFVFCCIWFIGNGIEVFVICFAFGKLVEFFGDVIFKLLFLILVIK